MFKDEDDYIWRSDDHIIEMRKSELDDQKSMSFWTGIGIGMLATIVSFAFGFTYLFTH